MIPNPGIRPPLDPRLRNPWGPWHPGIGDPKGLPLPPGISGKSGMRFRPFETLNTKQITDLRHNPFFRFWLEHRRQTPALSDLSQRAYFNYYNAWQKANPMPKILPPGGVPPNPNWWNQHPAWPLPPMAYPPGSFGSRPGPPLPRRR
jgi:hypothetical protein